MRKTILFAFAALSVAFIALAQTPAVKLKKVTILGGGQHHDFQRWFNQEDTALLKAVASEVVYTEKPSDLVTAVDNSQVIYLSNNQPIPVEARKSLEGFLARGGGMLIVHAAGWYSWNDWPEYNRQWVGGGTRGHDAFGEFEVTIDQPDHPIFKGVPQSFKITDELYYFAADAAGPGVEVLATGKSPKSGRTFPVIYVTKHDKARIVGITLGHDGKAHELPAFRTILTNAAVWSAGK